MAGNNNKLLVVWISLGIIAILIIIAAILTYILHRRAKNKLKEKQRRRESVTILENFKSIEDLAWSYSAHARNKIFENESVPQPWTYLECNGPIYDGGAHSLTRPWINGGNRSNPIFDDSSDTSSTMEAAPQPTPGRKWKPAGQSYDIAFSDSLERDLQAWERDAGTWSAVQQYGVNLGKPERHPSVRSSSIGFGDSLHRELYRWANEGRGKNVRDYKVKQIEQMNRIHEMNGIKVSERHRASLSIIVINQRPSNASSHEQDVTNCRTNQLNRISLENVDEENLTPKMNRKRMSLREMQIERQKRSGTGDFYFKNESMFEDYKKRIREGAVPEVLYFQY